MARVLFVCLGNICRSPAAEAVFKDLVANHGLSERIEVDSAGTGDWHAGELPDARMRRHGAKRGYRLESRARQIKVQDFSTFDYIVTMDNANFSQVERLAPTTNESVKVLKMSSFCSQSHITEVPDPYYGGDEGFELVLDILEDACEGLLERIRKEHNL